MEPSRRVASSRASLLLLLLLFTLSGLAPGRTAATGVFQVRRKFPRHEGSGSGGGDQSTTWRPSGSTTDAATAASSPPSTSPSVAAASPPRPGSTSRRLGSAHRRRATTCRWTPAATSSGSTASPVTAAPARAASGCGAKIGGDLGSSTQAVDGILGFGQSNSSMLSQLASAGKVRKIFSHFLDTVNGGGIFAIGNVVQPKVKTTPLVPNMQHYNVNLKAIDVGGVTLQLPTNTFDIGESKGTIIDSGTTLAYLPEVVYKAILTAVFKKFQDMPFRNVQDFLCFQYPGSVDDGFPEITFHFEGDLPLNVYPHDYLFQNGIWPFQINWFFTT